MESESTIGDYRVLRTLGSGTTCKVKLAQNIHNGEYYAIKIVKKAHFAEKPNLETKIYREISLMRMADHPHIIKLHDVLESSRHIYIVLEYAPNGELFDYLVKNKCFTEDVAIDIFRQIIYALEYLHQHNICHRDLKPENILLDKNNRIKLADFGFARWMREGVAITSCGSPHYAAPEVIRGLEYDGKAADIWSAGVILFALLAGYLPFDDHSIHNLLQKVKRGKFTMPSDFHPDAKDLISKMMTVDVNQRITIDGIKNHPAFLYGLPRVYVIPTPIPLLNLQEPMNISCLNPKILQTLSRIGITKEECVENLQAEGSNQIKEFVDLMLQNNHLDDLPWDKAITELPDRDDLSGFGDGEIIIDNLPMTNSTMMSFSEVPRSLAIHASWLPMTPQIDYSNSEVFGPTLLPLSTVMCEIQKLLVSVLIPFFHPNDMVIIGKYEDNTFIRFEAEITESGLMLTVKTLGQTAAVGALLYEKITEFLQ